MMKQKYFGGTTGTQRREFFFYLAGIKKHIKGTVRDLEKQEIGVSQISKVETGILRRKKKGKGKETYERSEHV